MTIHTGTDLPPPVVTRHDTGRGDVLVVRDDLIPGGTKRRALPALLAELASTTDEVVYASPAYGYAQVAIAHAATATGHRATIFVAQRRTPHPRTTAARQAGASIVEVPHGYLTVVTARARDHATRTGAVLLPFGLDHPTMHAGLAHAARTVPLDRPPREVWAVAGSGTLIRALQHAWPHAEFHAVHIGRTPDAGRARIHTAPERFDQPARHPPPFPSCDTYDAKAWQFLLRHAAPGALFWNVAG